MESQAAKIWPMTSTPSSCTQNIRLGKVSWTNLFLLIAHTEAYQVLEQDLDSDLTTVNKWRAFVW
jgi:hypothetical protein